jgi:hypothetical protein
MTGNNGKGGMSGNYANIYKAGESGGKEMYVVAIWPDYENTMGEQPKTQQVILPLAGAIKYSGKLAKKGIEVLPGHFPGPNQSKDGKALLLANIEVGELDKILQGRDIISMHTLEQRLGVKK